MTASLARIALASALAVLAGLPLVAPGRRPRAGDLAAAWTVALGNAAVLALAAGLAGLRLTPAVLALILVAPGAAAAALGRWRRRRVRRAGRSAPAPAPSAVSVPVPAGASGGAAGGGALVLLSRLALAAALAVLAIKMVEIPLWSWDHFAIWGVKARRLLEDGHLRLDFLRTLYQTRTDHPLGLPMAWLLLTLGEPPDPAVFKALHGLFGLALVAALRGAVRRATASAALANAAAAFLAVSPLLWDSEAVGLAEVPLALWATTSLLLALQARAAPPGGEAPPGGQAWQTALAPGLALGFLPWIKQEGLVLGLLLLAAIPFLVRRGGRAGAAAWHVALGAPALALMAAALAVQKRVLPPGVSFFVGDWWQRGLARLPAAIDIQRRCLAFLLQPDWLGFWIALAALSCVAAVRKRAVPLALFATVWIQLLVYELTALFSYLPPADHLNAAFYRISGALLPIGCLGLAALLGEAPDGAAGPGP
jgi:hypothetical protein